MNKIHPSKNALRTGAYSRDTLLPWENAADYEKHRADILVDLQPEGKIQIGIASDYAENCWIREETRHMTAVATRRHPFGEALEKSCARSWQDVLEIVRKRGNEDRKLLQSIARKNEAIYADRPRHDLKSRSGRPAGKTAGNYRRMLRELETARPHGGSESTKLRNFFKSTRLSVCTSDFFSKTHSTRKVKNSSRAS